MARPHLSAELTHPVQAPGADLVFNLRAAQTHRQRVLNERLECSPAVAARSHTDAAQDLGEPWIPDLPPHVLPYLHLSGYCESNRLPRFAVQPFGTPWHGHGRVVAIRDWVTREPTDAAEA